MIRRTGLTFHTTAFWLTLLITVFGSTEVWSGEVIDKTNWEQAEGLVPHTILNWVKAGKLTLHLGELNYDPAIYLPQHALDALKGNIGKYDIDEKGWVVEAATGKPAMQVMGFPFPEIDVNDPTAAEKIMHNKMYT